MIECSSYLSSALDGETLSKMVTNAKKVLHPIKHKFDYIAFTGNSGAIFAPLLAARMKKRLILLRKDAETSHSSYDIESSQDIYKGSYLIVDDLIDTGATIDSIVQRIGERCSQLRCVGIYLYNPWRLHQKQYTVPGRHLRLKVYSKNK